MPGRVIPLPPGRTAIVIPLRGRRPLARVTCLRPRSAKTETVYRTQRRPLAAELLAERSVCEVPWCTALATDLHEVQTRARGGSITDRANIRLVCRRHNSMFASEEADWMYDLGFLAHSWPDGGDAA
jgi:hypothetical protein